MPAAQPGRQRTAERPDLLTAWSTLAKRPEWIKLLQLTNYAAQIG
jgi:hypothetical protein